MGDLFALRGPLAMQERQPTLTVDPLESVEGFLSAAHNHDGRPGSFAPPPQPLPLVRPQSREINLKPAPAPARAYTSSLELEGLAYDAGTEVGRVIAGRRVGLASPPPSPELRRAASPLSHFEPGADRGALGPDPTKPKKRPFGLVSEGRRPSKKPDKVKPPSPLPAKEALLRSFSSTYAKPTAKQADGTTLGKPEPSIAFPSGRVGAELPPLERGPNTRDRASLKLGRYLLQPNSDPKPWRSASSVGLGGNGSSLQSQLEVHEEAAQLRIKWHAAGQLNEPLPGSLQADLSARQAIRPSDKAARFFLDRWLKSFDSRTDESQTVALSTRLLARFSAAAVTHSLTQDQPSDDTRPAPSRAIVAVACATFDDLCNAIGESLPALNELRRCVFEAMFLDEPRPVGDCKPTKLLRWAEDGAATPTSYEDRRLWCEGGSLGEVKQARADLEKLKGLLEASERAHASTQDELNGVEVQMALQQVVKRQDDATIDKNGRAHKAADMCSNALRSLLDEETEAHALTKAGVHEKIANMKNLIHGNCDKERRKWKICRMLILASMKGLEEKYVDAHEFKEEQKRLRFEAEARLKKIEDAADAKDAAHQTEKEALEENLRLANERFEIQLKRAQDLHEENLVLRAKASGGLGTEDRGALEQLSDLEREVAALKLDVTEKDVLLVDQALEAAVTADRIDALEAVGAARAVATEAAHTYAVELEGGNAAKTETIAALEQRQAELEDELAAFREEAAQRLLNGSADELALRKALETAEVAVDERRAHAAYLECLASHAEARTAAEVSEAARRAEDDRTMALNAVDQALANASAASALQRDDACAAASASTEALVRVEWARADARADAEHDRASATNASDADSALSKLRAELAGRDTTIERLTGELGDAQARIAALEQELGAATTRCAQLEQERDEAAAAAAAAADDALRASAGDAEALREAARLREEEAARRLAETEAQAALEAEATRRAAEAARMAEEEALARAAADARSASSGQAEVEALQATVAALQVELDEAHLEIDKLQKLIAPAELTDLASAFGFAEGGDEATDQITEIRPQTAERPPTSGSGRPTTAGSNASSAGLRLEGVRAEMERALQRAAAELEAAQQATADAIVRAEASEAAHADALKRCEEVETARADAFERGDASEAAFDALQTSAPVHVEQVVVGDAEREAQLRKQADLRVEAAQGAMAAAERERDAALLAAAIAGDRAAASEAVVGALNETHALALDDMKTDRDADARADEQRAAAAAALRTLEDALRAERAAFDACASSLNRAVTRAARLSASLESGAAESMSIADHEDQLASLREVHAAEIKALQEAADALALQHAEALEALAQEHAEALEKARREGADMLEAAQKAAVDALAKARADAAAALEQARQYASNALNQARQDALRAGGDEDAARALEALRAQLEATQAEHAKALEALQNDTEAIKAANAAALEACKVAQLEAHTAQAADHAALVETMSRAHAVELEKVLVELEKVLRANDTTLLEAQLAAALEEIALLKGDVDAAAQSGDASDRQVQRQLKGVQAQERKCKELQALVDEVRNGLGELQTDMTSKMPLPRLHRLVAQLLLRLGAAPPGDNALRALSTIISLQKKYKRRISERKVKKRDALDAAHAAKRAMASEAERLTTNGDDEGRKVCEKQLRRMEAQDGARLRSDAKRTEEDEARRVRDAKEDLGDDVVIATNALHREQLAKEARELSSTILADVAQQEELEAAAGASRFGKEKLRKFVEELSTKRRRLRAIGWKVPLFDAGGACDTNMEHRAYEVEHQRDVLQEKNLALQLKIRDDLHESEKAVARVRRVLKLAEKEKVAEFSRRVEAEGTLEGVQTELDRMKAEEERVRKLCGDSGMPPVQLLGTVVGTLLEERRHAALLVEALVRVQEEVVELCGLEEPVEEAPVSTVAAAASPFATLAPETNGPVATRVKMDPSNYTLTTKPTRTKARPPPKVVPSSKRAAVASTHERVAVPQLDTLAPSVQSTTLKKRPPVPQKALRYDAINGVGPLIPATLQKALTLTITPFLEAHERALPEVKERLRRRVLFGEQWKRHDEFFKSADPLLLLSVAKNATRLNKNLTKHAYAADDCNLKLEGLVGLTEARAAEQAEDFYLARAVTDKGHLSETMRDWALARKKSIGGPDLARGLQERPVSRVKMIEAPELPGREVRAATRRGLPAVETVNSIRMPGRPADEDPE